VHALVAGCVTEQCTNNDEYNGGHLWCEFFVLSSEIV